MARTEFKVYIRKSHPRSSETEAGKRDLMIKFYTCRYRMIPIKELKNLKMIMHFSKYNKDLFMKYSLKLPIPTIYCVVWFETFVSHFPNPTTGKESITVRDVVSRLSKHKSNSMASRSKIDTKIRAFLRKHCSSEGQAINEEQLQSSQSDSSDQSTLDSDILPTFDQSQSLPNTEQIDKDGTRCVAPDPVPTPSVIGRSTISSSAERIGIASKHCSVVRETKNKKQRQRSQSNSSGESASDETVPSTSYQNTEDKDQQEMIGEGTQNLMGQFVQGRPDNNSPTTSYQSQTPPSMENVNEDSESEGTRSVAPEPMSTPPVSGQTTRSSSVQGTDQIDEEGLGTDQADARTGEMNQEVGEPDGRNQEVGEPYGMDQEVGEPDEMGQEVGEPDGMDQEVGDPDWIHQEVGEPDGANREVREPGEADQEFGGAVWTSLGVGETDEAGQAFIGSEMDRNNSTTIQLLNLLEEPLDDYQYAWGPPVTERITRPARPIKVEQTHLGNQQQQQSPASYSSGSFDQYALQSPFASDETGQSTSGASQFAYNEFYYDQSYQSPLALSQYQRAYPNGVYEGNGYMFASHYSNNMPSTSSQRARATHAPHPAATGVNAGYDYLFTHPSLHNIPSTSSASIHGPVVDGEIEGAIESNVQPGGFRNRQVELPSSPQYYIQQNEPLESSNNDEIYNQKPCPLEEKKLPESDQLYLPTGATHNWKVWKESHWTEWALQFAEHEKDIEWINTEGVNIFIMKKLQANETSFKSWNMRASFQECLVQHFNKVYNFNNGHR